MKFLLTVITAVALGASAALAATSPETVPGATTVSTERAAELFDDGVMFVDVRKGSDFDAGRVPGALHLDVKSALTAESLSEEVEKDQEVVFYCNGHSCMRSSQASAMAAEWGFTKIYYYRDGFPAWEAAGMPVE